jgi:hypothetical protein
MSYPNNMPPSADIPVARWISRVWPCLAAAFMAFASPNPGPLANLRGRQIDAVDGQPHIMGLTGAGQTEARAALL